jgi:hypothetical protein
MSAFATGSAFAAPWVVTSSSDDILDTGSLRYAIVNAAAGDTITFALSEYPALIQLTGTNLDAILSIQKSLSIVGPGASQLTIKAVSDDNSAFNVFNVSQPSTPTADIDVAISGLRIENGGSGIWSSGYGFDTAYTVHLTLADLELVNNYDGVDVDYGATATITRSTITGGDFGINVYSYAPNGLCEVTIENSTLSNNQSAVYNAYGNVTIRNSTLVGNGLDMTDPFWAGIIGDAGSTTTLVFSTVSGSANLVTPGIRAYDASAVFNLKNTLMAGHSSGNCAAQITSLDHNLSDDASCMLQGTHDLDNTAAGLDPAGLTSNGGATQTIALLRDSAAMDAVPLADCTDAQDDPVVVDQRGFLRPIGAGCEIGAYELNDEIFSSDFEM